MSSYLDLELFTTKYVDTSTAHFELERQTSVPREIIFKIPSIFSMYANCKKNYPN